MRALTCEVLVVGAGPAGLSAASSAGACGARVGLVDDNPTTGGQIWRGDIDHAPTARARRCLEQAGQGNVTVLTQTRVIAPLEPAAVLADAPEGPLAISYDRLILAPGARERFLPFPGWTLPGVMGAGGLQALVKGGLRIAGKRVVVAGSGPLLLAVAAYLRRKGAHILLIAEQTPWSQLVAFGLRLLDAPEKLAQAGRFAWELRGVPRRASCWVVQVHGDDRLEAVTVRLPGGMWRQPCDYLACGFGLTPNLELPLAFGCASTAGRVEVDEWQQTSRAGVYCAGEATGVGGLEKSLVEGQIAGYAAARQWSRARARFAARARARRFAAQLERGFALRDALKALPRDDTIVCRCEDLPYGDLRDHTNWRGAKLHTRCGMGPCQGRVCGAATAFLCGWTQDAVRPPVTAAPLGSLAQSETPIHLSEEARV